LDFIQLQLQLHSGMYTERWRILVAVKNRKTPFAAIKLYHNIHSFHETRISNSTAGLIAKFCQYSQMAMYGQQPG